MRILVISNNYPPYFDGISIHTNNLVEQLRNKGHTIKNLNFDKEFSKKFSIRDFFYSKATYHSYYSPFTILNPYFLSHPDKGLRNYVFTNLVSRVSKKYINGFQPDIIHITYPRLFSAIENTSIPTVLSVYSEEIRDTYPVKNLLQKVNAIIPISNFTNDLVKQVNPDAENKTTIIPCSIETDKYVNKYPYGERENYIVSIGRLSKEKNFDTTIKAFSLLPEDIKKKYTYFIIGGGPEEQTLQRLINNLDLQDSVKLLGNVDDDQKIRYLTKSKAFIMCPRIKKGEQEGFGIVYLEAQAAQVPIVTSEIGGIREAVGDAGVYINNPEKPKAIAIALEKLLRNQELSKELIQIGKKRIQNYDHDIWIDQILNVYKELLNTK